MKSSLQHLLCGLLAIAGSSVLLTIAPAEAATLTPGSTLNIAGFVKFDNTPVVPPAGGSLLFANSASAYAGIGTYGVFSSAFNTGSFAQVTSGSILSTAFGTAPVDFLKFNAANLVPTEVTFDLTSPLAYNSTLVDVNGSAYRQYNISASGIFESEPNTNLGTGLLTLQFRIPSAGTDAQTSYSGTFVVGSPIAVPEPAPFVGLLGLGLLGAAIVRRRGLLSGVQV